MTFEIKGKIHKIMEPKQVSDKFRKCDFVIEVDDGKYPQLVSFQIVNDKIDQLLEHKANDIVTVQFNIRGREWTSPQGDVKYFNTLDAWKLVGDAKAKAPLAKEPGYVAESSGGSATDDIPFLSCAIADDVNPIAKVLR